MRINILHKAKEKTIIFDGAMGSMLMAAGLPMNEPPILWNKKKPTAVMDIHRQYFESGSDVVHTNTFVGNPLRLADQSLMDKTVLLNREGARIAREACPDQKCVAGDMGPTGKLLKPNGPLSPEEVEEAFYTQASALMEGGIDFISIETMFSLEEAMLAVKGAKRAGADIPVFASITFDKTQRGFFTMMGENIDQSASGLEEAGADVIGANCSIGSAEMIDLAKELRAATQKPILLQPNAGNPVRQGGVTTYQQSPSQFASDGLEIIKAGAHMIGGCCGTTPDFIKALAGTIS